MLAYQKALPSRGDYTLFLPSCKLYLVLCVTFYFANSSDKKDLRDIYDNAR